jgi:hypothetical protein
MPAPCEQVVSSGFAGCVGVPLVQTSLVQALPSSVGVSVSSVTVVVPPNPSHCSLRQFPATTSAAVPACAFEKPQVYAFPQTRMWQIESVPGQSVAATQMTHAGADELPLQSVPPSCAQAVRAGSGPWVGIPFTHVSEVQALPSSAGGSESKMACMTLPAPSQTLRLQSPVVWPVTTVFAAV